MYLASNYTFMYACFLYTFVHRCMLLSIYLSISIPYQQIVLTPTVAFHYKFEYECETRELIICPLKLVIQGTILLEVFKAEFGPPLNYLCLLFSIWRQVFYISNILDVVEMLYTYDTTSWGFL